jgi:membrane protease YdiL (CAAX protease family)
MIFIIGVIFSLVYIKTQNLIFLIGVHSLINIPFTLNKTDFPIALIVLLFTILISIFWNKFMEKNKGGFWKYDMVKE